MHKNSVQEHLSKNRIIMTSTARARSAQDCHAFMCQFHSWMECSNAQEFRPGAPVQEPHHHDLDSKRQFDASFCLVSACP